MKVKSMGSGVQILDMNLSFSLNLSSHLSWGVTGSTSVPSSIIWTVSNLQNNLMQYHKAHKKICIGGVV